MAWKLRKDKLKAGAPEAAEQPSPEPPPTASADEAEQTPVFDLSGSAFRSESAGVSEEEPDVPSFLDDEPVIALGGSSAYVEVPTLQPIELEPLATELLPAEAAAEPSFLSDPLPDFDPIVALPSDLEPEAIAIAPMTISPEAADVDQAPVPTFEESAHSVPPASPGREAIAPGLVTLETETGLPKVAPFVLDTPPTPSAAEAPRLHSIVVRIGKLSATQFLTKDVTTIGRPDGIVQNYPDIEIELDDGVSRRHAEIRHMKPGYAIVDVGSTNGTFLNGESLTPNAPVALHAGDRIRLGELTELLFE